MSCMSCPQHFKAQHANLPPLSLPSPQLYFTGTAKALPAVRPGLPPHAQPTDVDAETSSLPELMRASVLRADVDCRKDLLANTCLVGGGSLIDGVSPRLSYELGGLLPPHLKCRLQVRTCTCTCTYLESKLRFTDPFYGTH